MTVLHIGSIGATAARLYRDNGAGHAIFVEPMPNRAETLAADLAALETASRPRWSHWLQLPRTRFTVLTALIGDQDGVDVALSSDPGGAAADQLGNQQVQRRLDPLLRDKGFSGVSMDCVVFADAAPTVETLRGAQATLEMAAFLEMPVAHGTEDDDRALWLLERGFDPISLRFDQDDLNRVLYRRH